MNAFTKVGASKDVIATADAAASERFPKRTDEQVAAGGSDGSPNQPRTWEEVCSAYIAAQDAEAALYGREGHLPDEVVEPVAATRYRALHEMLMLPAPSLDALAIKLAIYAGDDAHEYGDARIFQARFVADAVRLAAEVSGAQHLVPLMREQIASAEKHLQYEGEAYRHDGDRAVAEIYKDVLTDLEGCAAASHTGIDRQEHGPWDRYRAAFIEFRNEEMDDDILLGRVPPPPGSSLARMDAAEEEMLSPSSCPRQIAGKLRRVFQSAMGDAWVDDFILQPAGSPRTEDLEMSGLSDRILWSAVEDLDRMVPTPMISRVEWDAAYAGYIKAEAALDNCDLDSRRGQTSAKRHFKALEALMSTPAPTNSELAVKIRLLPTMTGSAASVGGVNYLDVLAEDCSRLASAAHA